MRVGKQSSPAQCGREQQKPPEPSSQPSQVHRHLQLYLKSPYKEPSASAWTGPLPIERQRCVAVHGHIIHHDDSLGDREFLPCREDASYSAKTLLLPHLCLSVTYNQPINQHKY